MRRMGVLGGTFDPIHQGHLTLAEKAIRTFGLDGVYLAPAGNPPHKDDVAVSFEHRLQMCRLAVQNHPQIHVTDADMRDGKASYTAFLMKRLHKEYPDTLFFFMIGADKLPSLPRWHKAEELFKLCDFIVCPRDGELDAAALEKVRQSGASVHVLETAHFPGASHEIRDQLARHEDPQELPESVLAYIAKNGLYRKDILPKLQGMMNGHRFIHTLGVRDMAVDLALRYRIPVMKSALAALLHDCAKGMPAKELRKLALEWHLTEDEEILSSGALLHGIVGAELAREKFGVTDEEILSAIRCHTMGKPDMTPLELNIFVADAIEMNREPYEGLEKIRCLAQTSLRCAALQSFYGTRDYVLSQGKNFAGRSCDTMRDLESRLTEEEKMLMHA